jgi:hypothetical protein
VAGQLLLAAAAAAALAGTARALTISSGSHTPSWMALTRFTGALLGVKRSMVVMVCEFGPVGYSTGPEVTLLLSCAKQLLHSLHAGA